MLIITAATDQMIALGHEINAEHWTPGERGLSNVCLNCGRVVGVTENGELWGTALNGACPDRKYTFVEHNQHDLLHESIQRRVKEPEALLKSKASFLSSDSLPSGQQTATPRAGDRGNRWVWVFLAAVFVVVIGIVSLAPRTLEDDRLSREGLSPDFCKEHPSAATCGGPSNPPSPAISARAETEAATKFQREKFLKSANDAGQGQIRVYFDSRTLVYDSEYFFDDRQGGAANTQAQAELALQSSDKLCALGADRVLITGRVRKKSVALNCK